MPDVVEAPVRSPRPAPQAAWPTTTKGRRAVVGTTLLFGLLWISAAVGATRLDTARREIEIATSVDLVRAGTPALGVSNCFQGFCFEDDVSRLERSWDFSMTYLDLIGVGLLLAIAAAAVVDAYLLPLSTTAAYRRPGPLGSFRALRLESLSSAAGGSLLAWSRRGRPASPPAAAVATALLNGPALVMTVFLFSWYFSVLRIGVGVVMVAGLSVWTTGARTAPATPEDRAAPEPWRRVLSRGAADAAIAAFRFGRRLLPAFLVAAVLGGLFAQVLSTAAVDAAMGDHLVGVVLAAALGLLLSVPLLTAIPFVAFALLIGVGVVPAAVLLAATAGVGPVTLASIARRHGGPAAAAVAAGVAAVTIAGGAGALAMDVAAPVGQVVAFDGSACTYEGAARIAPRPTAFELRNDTSDENDGATLTVVIGRLPESVSLDQFAFDVGLDPRAELPGYFTEAGSHDFVFPGTSQVVDFTFHEPGTYVAVCLHGGSNYVLREFSMNQPLGWWHEFRELYRAVPPDRVFRVAG